MGQMCLSRDEDPDEDFQIYEKYKKLQDEVGATLGNRERFSEECGLSYRAACESRGVQLLNKPLMMEMTRHFLQKLACDDDPRMVAKIYLSLERQFPNEEEAIPEAAFKEFIQDVLIQIDRDIGEKLRKLEARYPGALRDATAVRYGDDEQLAIDEGYPQGGSRGGARASQTEDRQRLEEEEQRHKLWKRQQEQLRVAEDQRLRALRSKDMDFTHEANQAQKAPSPTASFSGQERLQMLQQRSGIPAFVQPPPTQPQAQPPLSAAQIQRLQNSLAQQGQGQPPTTQQVDSPSSGDMRYPVPVMQGAAGYQDHLRPPLTNTPPAVAAQSPMPSSVGPPTPGMPSVAPGTPNMPGAPPPTVNQSVAASLPEFSQEDVERMKHQITANTDGLKVQVYNQHLQLEPKRLSLNLQLGKIGIFDVGEGGLGYPTAFFDIPDLKCITQGISSAIMEAPPQPEVSLGFRFSQELPDTKDRSQDKFLCFVFDSPEMCLLAGEAFSQICGVPVAPAI